MATLLEYSPPTASTSARRKRRWPWVVLASPMAVIPFVPFTCSTSPVSVATEWIADRGTVHREDVMILGLAAGLIAGLPIYLWRLRMVLWRRAFGQFDRIAAQVIAVGTAASFLLAQGLCIHASLDATAWTAIGVSFGFFCAGATLLWFARRARATSDYALVGMLVPYASNAIFCLIGFFDKPQLGWYLALWVTPLAMLDIAFFAIAAARRRLACDVQKAASPASVGTSGLIAETFERPGFTPPNPAPP